jgi:hypothetical protein
MLGNRDDRPRPGFSAANISLKTCSSSATCSMTSKVPTTSNYPRAAILRASICSSATSGPNLWACKIEAASLQLTASEDELRKSRAKRQQDRAGAAPDFEKITSLGKMLLYKRGDQTRMVHEPEVRLLEFHQHAEMLKIKTDRSIGELRCQARYPIDERDRKPAGMAGPIGLPWPIRIGKYRRNQDTLDSTTLIHL